ncbi:MAG TPA: GAF domain-containing protein [Anaerolineae bacterium]|nr:GAF domain-containing protein [Anaerolineae bacterium]
MFFTRSLRAKTLLYVLIPTALGLLAVATIALYAYERVAQDVVQQRDAELARLQAARLSEGLHEYAELLQDFAMQRDVQSMDVDRLAVATMKAPEQFKHFDAGVIIFNEEGVMVWAIHAIPGRRGTDYPLPSQFDLIRLTRQPALSDVFTDPLTGEGLISLAVPVLDAAGQFTGVVAGLQTVGGSPFAQVYADLLQVTSEQSRQAYVVDGNGRVIYHSDASRTGTDLSNWTPVSRATVGEIGAVLTDNEAGDPVVSGFAPVPNTRWALVTQQSWEDIIGPIRGYSRLILTVLIIAGFSSGALVFFSIGRALRPIHDLTRGAERIAGGDFDYTIRAQTGDEVETLGEQFNLMARALRESYADLEQKVADRTKELAALNAIAEVVSSTLDLGEVLGDALDKTLEVMGVEAGGIYLLQTPRGATEQGTLTIASHRGMSPDFIAAIDNLKVGEGFSGRVVQTGEPLVVPDLSREPGLTRPAVAESGFRTVAIVPLASRDRIWGSLFVITRSAREFSEQDVELLNHIADQVAVAIDNARLFAAQQRRAEQFRVISEMGRRITSVLTTDDLLREIVRLVKESFGYYVVGISLIEGEVLVERAGSGPPFEDRDFQLPSMRVGGQGITASVAATGEPLLVSDVSQDPRYLSVPGMSETRSELCVPLKTKEGVIGVLNVESDQLNAFDDSDLAVLQSVARQAAVAIENAQLYEDTKSRLAQVTALQETTGAVASTLELDPLLNLIIEQATTLLQGDAGIINVVDWGSNEDQAVAVTGLPATALGDRAPLEGSLSGWVALHNQPVISNQVQQDSRADQRALSKLFREAGRRVRSVAIAPLTIKGLVMGTLVVLDKQRGQGEFDQTDLELLVAFASQAAMAMENARLFHGEQRRAEQFRVISDVSRHMTSTLNVDDLLDEIVRSIKETMGYYLVGISLIEGQDLVIKAGAGPPFEDPAFQPSRATVGGKGITGWVAGTGEPLLVRDVCQDERYFPLSPEAQTRSELCVPLKTKEAVIGVLNVESDELDAFDQNDLAILQSLANQAAIAIENAHLFASEQRRAEQFRLLSEVGTRITSLLTMDELLDQTARLVNEVLGYYLVGIGLVEGDELVVKAGAGPRWDDTKFHPPRVRLGRGISGWVARTGEPLLAPDVSQEPRYLLLDNSAETKSELAVPLRTKTEIIGVLDVQSDQLNAFDEGDLVVLQSLANLTAIAIEEARLLDAEQRRAEQFRVISEVGASITSILTVDELLQEIVRLVRTSLGYYHTAIGLLENGELVMKAGVGAHWEDPDFCPAHLEVGGEGITAWVASTGEPLLVPDVSLDSRYLLLPGSEEIKCEVAVPLKTTAGVIGVLDVQSDQIDGLDESDLAVLNSVAHQAAIAIENARLYQQAQQAAVLEERSRLARDLHDAVTQTLFSASLIGEVVPTVWESDEDEGRQLLQELRQLTRGALAEMRTLLLELRPAALAESSMDELLRQLCEAATGRSGAAITLAIEGDQGELPPDVLVALYRIAQEALNNVVKHARATDAQVRLRCTTRTDDAETERVRTAELSVTDNGCGFDALHVPPDRLGLGIIRERVEAIGATLRIESTPGVGTEVSVLWQSEE